MKYKFGQMTWPEVKEAVRTGRVAVVPVATIEDHGYHLPVDTDLTIALAVVERACEQVKEHAVMVPPITHGYSPHHMDFPGTITISATTFMNYLLDVVKSLAHQGFTRILLVNGHGSNRPLVEMAAREAVVQTESFCVAVSWWDIVSLKEKATSLREGPVPGSMGHACELETSMYLAIQPELVQMERAVDEVLATTTSGSDYFWGDLVGSGGRKSRAAWMEWWSALTESGVSGSATLATREKGLAMLEAASQGLASLILELKDWQRSPRINHHSE